MTDAPLATTSTETSTRENGGSGGPKAIIKNVDMVDEMQQESIDIASAAMEKFSIEKDIAAQIKKDFDKRHGPTWHVVVGKNFGSYVTHGKPSAPTPEPYSNPCPKKPNTSSTSTSGRSQFSSGSHEAT